MDKVLELPWTDNIYDNRLLTLQEDMGKASPEQILDVLSAINNYFIDLGADDSDTLKEAYSKVHEAVFWYCDYLQQNGYDIS